MEIIRLIASNLKTNSYVLIQDDEVIIIDPEARKEKYDKLLEGKTLKAILLTHGHFDHIRSADDLVNDYRVPLYMSSNDCEVLAFNRRFFGCNATVLSPITPLEEGHYQIGSFEFEAFATPGHTPGSFVFVFPGHLFTGDTLFKGSIGITDLPGGNARKMSESLRLFKTLDPSLIVHPGHDEESTIAEELAHNPYL